MKISFKKIVVLISAIILIAVAAAYMSIDRIAVLSLSKTYDLDITYSAIKRVSLTHFSFEALTCIDKKRRVGFLAGSADIKADLKDMAVVFLLRDVRFVKKGPENAASLDSLASLVTTPFRTNLQYLEMSGSVKPTGDGLEVKDFTASSPVLRLTLKGAIHNNGIMKSDISIYFSPDLVKNIPQELSTALLRDDANGWKSLTVSLSGDYKKPSIQVTGKLFRLSVKEISAEK